MIEVQHLTKRYGPVTAVDDVSFRVEKGEILGFLGPNGAGKTTTMRVLTGYMPATEGKAVVAGYDVFQHPIEAKRRTGYLPETPPLYPEMTVREYLHFVARLKLGKTTKAERTQRVETRDAEDAHRRHGRSPLRETVEGLPAARRSGSGADSRSRGADSGRTDRRARSQADHRDARADSKPGRRSHHRAQHAHPARSGSDVPARGHHQQGTRRRSRHAGQPDPPVEGRSHALCAGRRRRTGGRHAPHVAWRAERLDRGSTTDR